ncbi:hypothetical protein [Flexilinea flocculi]|nr:hypothetical protein [Flexilinea flocculi]
MSLLYQFLPLQNGIAIRNLSLLLPWMGVAISPPQVRQSAIRK